MNVGKRSLMNSQTGLQTVSHNIANKSTEGYSRQRVDFKTSPPTGIGNHQIGTGADIGAIIRVNNPHLEKQLQVENEKMGHATGRQYYMNRVEEVLNDQNNKGVGHFLAEFFNAFRDLSNNPESLPLRTNVKETALNLTKDFHRINEQLKSIKTGVDNELEVQVTEVNRITSQIADLNKKIASTEIGGFAANANDYRDQRDTLVKKLGELMNIKVSEGKAGMINITAGNTVVLVADMDSGFLEAAQTPEHGNKREGNVDLIYSNSKDGSKFIVTNQITGGKIGGAIEVRDQTINNLLDRVDNLAFILAEKVNQAHIRGFNQYDQPSGLFFDQPEIARDASAKLELNGEIYNDVTRIGTAAIQNAPGDNRVAQVIAAIQHERVMPDGIHSMEEYYKGMIGDLAVMTKKANSVVEHQKNVIEQMKNLRESISGVSLDEETIKMIEFQKSFDASAKLIKTVDEMLDTVINLKR